ncbi:restriction endonuclease subunit S [Peribacillus sp. Hz7]|uniref:restriction endonuclease subunit S n=1 Tax=Peribacillus sp. Hz7 TaxID=3344873 RepID=UPI0035CBF320
MHSKWSVKKLGEIINLKRGYDLPVQNRINGITPIISSSGINGYHNEAKVSGPGVVTGRSGQLGKVFFIDQDYWPLNTTLYVEDFKGNNEKYVYYLLQTLDFEKFNAGSSVPTLNRNHVHLLDVYVPDYHTQSRIGDFLYSFEEKIKINLDIIKNLEQLSQTLYKRWFIDFDYLNEEGLPYKSSGGKMVDSELGEIPEGWNIEYLSSSTEFLSGGTPKTKESTYWNGDIPFFTPKDVGSSVYTTNTEKTITELGLSKCNSRLYPKNTVFITARGTVGKIALANTDMAMNQSCFALKSKNGCQFHLYGAIKTLLREIIQGANGAVFNAINLSDLNRLRLAMPQQELIDKYEAVAITLFNQMSALEVENIKLQILRDTLLPKLLSGEIEIPDESVVV